MNSPLPDHNGPTLSYTDMAMIYDAVSTLYETKRDNLARALYLERPERTIASLQRRFDEVDRLHSKVRSLTMDLGESTTEAVLRVG